MFEEIAGPPVRDGGALADDLRRVGDGEPNLARPVGAVGRAAKCARRRPAVAALSAGLAAAILVAFALIGNQARVAADVARREAAARLRTREILDAMIDGALDDILGRSPQLGPRETVFLGEILRRYEELTAESGDAAADRLATGRAFNRAANLRDKLNLTDAEAEPLRRHRFGRGP